MGAETLTMKTKTGSRPRGVRHELHGYNDYSRRAEKSVAARADRRCDLYLCEASGRARVQVRLAGLALPGEPRPSINADDQEGERWGPQAQTIAEGAAIEAAYETLAALTAARPSPDTI